MRVLVGVKPGCEHPQFLQRQIAEAAHPRPRNGIHPIGDVAEDSKLRQAGNATTANYICPTRVTNFTKPSNVVEQDPRIVLERC